MKIPRQGVPPRTLPRPPTFHYVPFVAVLSRVLALTGTDGQRQRALAPGKRAEPARVVCARGIVGIVEVQHDTPASVARASRIERGGRDPFERAAFRGIEEIPPATVTFIPAGGVAEGQEEAAAIDVNPVDGQMRQSAAEGEIYARGES